MIDFNSDVPFCELTAFLHFWLTLRPINTPKDGCMDFADKISGIVLYRSGQYQVQLFNLAPNAIIESHCHPNVDSYEVHIGGELAFEVDGCRHENRALLDQIRIFPSSMHKAFSGDQGGCFISVQKWLNGVPPSTVGHDWFDIEGNQKGTASLAIDETIKTPSKAKLIPSDYYEAK